MVCVRTVIRSAGVRALRRPELSRGCMRFVYFDRRRMNMSEKADG